MERPPFCPFFRRPDSGFPLLFDRKFAILALPNKKFVRVHKKFPYPSGKRGRFHESCRRDLPAKLPGHPGPRRLGHGPGGAPPLGRRHPRPHGEKVRHREPLRSPGGISHPHRPPDLLEDGGGRAALDLAEKEQQHPRPERPHLGLLGGRDRLHRQGLRLSAGGEAPLPRGGLRPGGPGALRPEAQSRFPAHPDESLYLPGPPRDASLSLRLLHDLQRLRPTR